jgi:glucose/arabinose dehydrogenase
MRKIACLVSCSAFLLGAGLQAQVLTHGKQPTLPPPYATPGVSRPAEYQQPPAGWKPTAPAGLKVNAFARGLDAPRWMAVAPNGDVFVAETDPGRVLVLHDPNHSGESQGQTVFADGLNRPFGIAFHDNYVYVGDTDQVLRFPYDPKTSARKGSGEHVLDLPPRGMHYTRSIAFSKDGMHLFVSAGSDCNVCAETDPRRAAVQIADPDGRNARIYASGLRNATGLGVNPDSGQVWVAVNERDMLGDNLPPDYFTHIVDGGFYGWPWSYIGHNLDKRVKTRPEMVARAIVPDVLLVAHVAPLQFQFYEASSLGSRYRHGAFIAEHGSWNRSTRSGNQVVFVAFDSEGHPTEIPKPFLTGFIPDPNSTNEYGRPVGIAVLPDGSLLVSDDDGGMIWRVSK